MPRALLSVHDKTGLIDLGRALVDLGWELVASGGTSKALAAAGLPVRAVEEVTGHPEMLGGRVKTLHPAIHGGILARATDEDMQALAANGYAPFDLVVSNLYPFQETVSKPGITLEDAIEQIDIGGVTLLRAAAKNFARVAVLCDPADYTVVIDDLRSSGSIDAKLRRSLAIKAFAHTRDYDTAISAYLIAQSDAETETFPAAKSVQLHRVDTLRYGENPHQQAAYYAFQPGSGPLGGTVLGGKQLSYNNLLDLDSAWNALSLFERPTVVIVKHLNPCGIASADSIVKAYPQALASDPTSAYGGVIAVNQVVDDAFVAALGDLFLEAIAAPGFTQSAQDTLHTKRKNCRLLCIDQTGSPDSVEYRSVRGGILVQTPDRGDPVGNEWRIVSKRQPTAEEMDALRFAWKAVQAVKSNSIVLVSGTATVGIGGGLSSRVDAAKLAVEKAGARAQGCVMASDAFFPFPDGALVGIEAGVTAIVHPGGSVRDAEVLKTVDEAGIAMVYTGVRHFRH